MFSRDMILTNPEMIPEIRREAKATLELIGFCDNLCKLRKYLDWSKFDWAYMCGWANKVDEPFVKLMLSLARHGYTYNVISMHKWWRRLKAVNQANVISFFTYTNFPGPTDKPLFWADLYAQCCRTKAMFEEMSKVYADDHFVEMNLRGLLGCSQQADIKEAWTKWAKSNHPDKGGSVDKFVIVKAAYEEWLLAKG